VPREIFEPKEEATGEWRKIHNTEIHDLHSSQNIHVSNQEK
jgi:hypothetical protein